MECGTPRVAGIVMPFYTHHVTWLGNRRQKAFFKDQDYAAYLYPMQFT